jgi:hypothetical protein
MIETQIDTIDKTRWIPEGEEVITPEQKRNIVITEGDRGGRQIRALTRPLDYYVAHRHISGNQYRAGERLYKLWHYSILRMRYARMKFGEVIGESDAESLALAPRDLLEAYQSITHPKTLDVVRMVCIDETKVGRGGQMNLLKDGLNILIAHFKAKNSPHA